jgi:hypothetical protein
MATTRLIAIHINKGKSIAQTLSLRTDYAQNPEKTKPLGDTLSTKPIENIISDNTAYAANPDKTHGGDLVRGYECDPHTVDEEFLLAKKDYEYLTSRDQGDKNVLAYHIRQSFKPGEITPELALEIGYELGLRFTKGRHAFIVATHTDKAHIHNHIVFNSTALCHTRKFKDFWRSGMALQKVSDLLCLENGLSVIENPEPSKGRNYHKWLGDKEPTWQNKLRQKIDEILPSCTSFENFLAAMRAAGYKVKERRKNISLSAPGQKNFTRLNTLEGEHTEDAIRRRIEEYNKLRKSEKTAEPVIVVPIEPATIKVSWLIDIQAKLQQGKGAGYEHWAHLFNIKEMSKTLLYLKEQGIDSYDELVEKAADASAEFSEVTAEIKTIESRQQEIAELQRQIGTYGKTRDTYNAYKRSGFDPDFYEKNRSAIALHEAARKHFDSLGVKKLPKISELKQEYAALQAQKKKLYVSYHVLKDKSRELLVAKHNAQRILDIKPDTVDMRSREHSRTKPHAETPVI